tara:strand:+ start:52 stop:447 length:396 start_codon:yes stop_codon:yes gene_type:complete
MNLKHNNKNLELRIEGDCVDIFIEDSFVGSFDLNKDDYDYNDGGYIYLIPEAIDFQAHQRQGFYSKVIDTVLSYNFLQELKSKVSENAKFSFKSVKRNENACNFWLKRGYGEEYDQDDHNNGDQEEIEIEL